MRNQRPSLLLALATTCLCGASWLGAAHAQIIDFEMVPSGSGSAVAATDVLEITDQFNGEPYWVTFSLKDRAAGPLLAKAGSPRTAFVGISRDTECDTTAMFTQDDMPAEDQDVGCFFLTDDDAVQPDPPVLVLEYDPAHTTKYASGVLLDIDGEEAWTITAFRQDDSEITSILLTSTSNGAGDAMAAPWEFDLAEDIYSIEIEYTGANARNVGLAFDNFHARSPNVCDGELIDFETYPDGGTPSEGDPIGAQWAVYPWRVVIWVEVGTDTQPAFLSSVGSPRTAFSGAERVDACAPDGTSEDKPAADQGVGCMFLTDDQNNYQTAGPLVIQYLDSVHAVSGDLIDVEGHEVFLVEAYGCDWSVLDDMTISSSSPGAGDGMAATFSLTSPNGGNEICYLKISYQDVPTVGFGLDNLCFSRIPLIYDEFGARSWHTNTTEQTAYDLTYIFAGNIDADEAFCDPFLDRHVTHGTFLDHEYTLIHWDNGSVAPDEEAETYIRWLQDLDGFRGAWWTDENSHFIGRAGPGYGWFWDVFRHDINTDHLDMRFEIAHQALDWTGTGYPPGPEDGPGEPIGPITFDDIRWTITQVVVPRGELTREIFEDSTYVWQSEPPVTLSYGETSALEFSKPGGFEEGDIVIVGYEISSDSLVCPQIHQVSYNELLAQVSAVPDGVVGGGVPRPAYLECAVPNPFNPSTKIRYHLDRNAQVEVEIYSLAGRLVDTLVDGVESAGSHTVTWNGRNRQGRRVASGVYFCRLKCAEQQDTLKIVLLK